MDFVFDGNEMQGLKQPARTIRRERVKEPYSALVHRALTHPQLLP
jgi:hypothetical protein